MFQKIKRFIDENQLIDKGDKILVGLSGGPDSIFLATVLLRLAGLYGAKIYACHIDHGYRKTSGVDAEFVKKFCSENGVPLASEKIKIKKFSEDSARVMRYEIFARAAKKFGCDKIATGHTLDDNAETVIMWLARGCGTNGLKGIPSKRGNIIRPVLCVSKKEILRFLKSRAAGYCTDETNSSCDFTRNKIRNKIMPLLEEINPRFAEHVFRLSRIISNKKVDIKSKKEYNKKDSFTPKETAVYFDAGMVDIKGLKVRHRKKGDSMVPFGIKGRKKLQDIFVDAKVPRGVRDVIPLVFCGKELLWAAGVRRSDHAKVARVTKTILKLELSAEKAAK